MLRANLAALVRFIAVWWVGLASITSARGQFVDTIPNTSYYDAIKSTYRGDYQEAVRELAGGGRGVRIGNAAWVDSICYFAARGDAYYQAGQYAQALTSFDTACNVLLQYRQWMLRVQFPSLQPDMTLARRVAPWGVSSRQVTPARMNGLMPISQGQFNAAGQALAAGGGAIQQLQMWEINAVEIVRASALAIRRRNEILGPLGKYNKLSTDLSRAYAGGGGAPPNHWSNAWISLLRGLASAGVGEREEAMRRLDDAVLLAGQFDHPLTCIALLEQGRLTMEAGESLPAESLFADASVSAFQYEDVACIDDAFRLIAINRLAGGAEDVSPLWNPAAAWTRRERLDHICARVQISGGQELLETGSPAPAQAALRDAQARMRYARMGPLGVAAAHLNARLQYATGKAGSGDPLAAVLAAQSQISLRNYQILLANQMFDAQTLPARGAIEVYALLMADPTPADVAARFLDSLAVMQTPHDSAFDRWYAATLERNNVLASLEVVDLAKRRRYHQFLPWGGRKDAVRTAAMTPDSPADPATAQAKRDLLAGFPELRNAMTAESELRAQVLAKWTADPDDESRRQMSKLWKDYGAAVLDREHEVTATALTRAPAPYEFPPRIETASLQNLLKPGEAILAFHETPKGLDAMLVTSKAATQWNCGATGRIGPTVTEFLRAIGNYDGNREMTTEQLVDDSWHVASDKVYAALFEGAKLTPHAIKSLVIVPDGIAWYVPFEAMWMETDDRSAPWISFTQIRYAPTIGLAFRAADQGDGPWRRVQRTGIVLGELIPGKKEEEQLSAIESLRNKVDGPLPIGDTFSTPMALAASALDAAIVLADVEPNSTDVLGWNPAPVPGDRNGALAEWLLLGGRGPQRVALPGMHTSAEAGGRGSRRGSGVAQGDELFVASCALMSAGAETALLSRWRVGGKSMRQIVSDFFVGAPTMAAADAWQRTVQLAMETSVDPASEFRVKSSKGVEAVTEAHPFFWSGYLVVDSGWRPPEPDEEEADEPADDAQAKAAAPPAAPPVLPDAQADAPEGGDPAKAEPNEPKAEEAEKAKADPAEPNDDVNPVPAAPTPPPPASE